MIGIVLICGDLSARRPGDTEARGTILIASRPCAAAAHSKHAGGNSPIFVSDAFSSVRDRLGIATARWCRTTDHGRPVPISFLGLCRALQPAQAERVWKRWQSMRTVNGDVYRALRNAYEAACIKIENAAAAMEREAQEIEASHAVVEIHPSPFGGVVAASEGAKSP